MGQLIALLVVGSIGAAASGWGLAREGRAVRAGALAGLLALLLLLVLTLAMDTPALDPVSDSGFGGPAAGGLFGGRLVPTTYLRLVLGLWGLDAVLLVLIAWLLGGLTRLRGVLPATLAAMTGGAVVFASADLAIGAAAAAGTGLAALLAIPPSRGRTSVAAAARELRMAVGVGAAMLAVVAVGPLTAALSLGDGSSGGTAVGAGGAVAAAGAVISLSALVVTLAVGARLGAIPFHVRFSRIADAATPVDLALLLAWLAVPVGVAGLAIVDGQVAPLALPLEGERIIIIGIALVTLAGAALAAYIQDDLRHTAGYLVIADGGLVLLGFAAFDPAAWGPARVWLVVMAASKTALAAWAAVAEDRFETRSIPDLRGWVRRSPILATGLVVTVVATFGVPGWVGFEARGTLARLAADAPWDAILVLASFLTLPTYLRLLALGVGPPTSRVDRAAPERIVRRRGEGVSLLKGRLPVETDRAIEVGQVTGAERVAEAGATPAESPVPAAGRAGAAAARARIAVAGTRGRSISRAQAAAFGPSARAAVVRAGRQLAVALRRDRTEILAAAVLALALLAALTAWGVLDIAGAAAEPAPITSGAASDY